MRLTGQRKAFTERYCKWCKRKGYNFSEEKALSVYAGSCGHVTTLPKNSNTKLLITTAAQQLLTAKTILVAMRMEMLRLAKLLPEYQAVYQFIDKKRSESKPYFLYMTADANKFLRIYYARVKECLAAQLCADTTTD